MPTPRSRILRFAAIGLLAAPAVLPTASFAGSSPVGVGHRPADDLVATSGAGMCLGSKVTIQAGVVPVIGTAGSDVIAGTPGPDVIYGMGGDDRICGFDGEDVIFGDSADPRVSDGGNDTINGGNGDDDIQGGPWQDFIHGSSGNDNIHGDVPGSPHGFADNIEGGMGHDEIIGGPGFDNLWGDRQDGGWGNDLVDTTTDAPDGGDTVWAGRGDDVILAENGTGQHVEGQAGRDTCLVDEALDTWATCEAVL